MKGIIDRVKDGYDCASAERAAMGVYSDKLRTWQKYGDVGESAPERPDFEKPSGGLERIGYWAGAGEKSNGDLKILLTGAAVGAAALIYYFS